MTIDRNRTIERPRPFRKAALAGALAALLLAPAPAAAQPTAKAGLEYNLIRDLRMQVSIGEVFDNAGTYPTFTSVTFSPAEYVKDGSGGLNDNIFMVARKTDSDLNALASPPPSTFTFTANVAMSNHEGETATASLTFRASYDRAPAQALSPATVPTTAPTALNPTTDAPPGTVVSKTLADTFDNAGTNPRFTGATFSTLDYYVSSSTGVFESRPDHVYVTAKTDAELRALASPPSSPFEVTATVTMENDESDTATGTITFRTSYVTAEELVARTAAATPPTPLNPTMDAPPGIPVYGTIADTFGNAGTNPRFTGVTFSTLDYYVSLNSGILASLDDRVYAAARPDAVLRALATPPPDPFEVTATVTMENDEGQTATGTITFGTSWVTAEEIAAVTPSATGPVVPKTSYRQNAPPGTLVGTDAVDVFDNAGTNPIFTDVTFSTLEYYDSSRSGLHGSSRLFVQPKTRQELLALPTPPPSPFEVTATVTMTNDQGQTATGTITFETSYASAEEIAAATTVPAPASAPAGPTPKASYRQNAAPGVLVGTDAVDVFDNAGTNPRFTAATFSTLDYYVSSRTGLLGQGAMAGRLFVRAKTSKELRALASPPPDPFSVTADVTMTNDEGQTATATITYETAYTTAAEFAALPPPTALNPTMNAPHGTLVSQTLAQTFGNAGTNPRFTGVTFSTLDYYVSSRTGIFEAHKDRVWVRAKTEAALRALASPPSSPFEVTATVTMENEEGHTATGTMTFKTEYTTAAETPAPEPAGPTVKAGLEWNLIRDLGMLVQIGEVFDNAGTYPTFTSVTFSPAEYVKDGSGGLNDNHFTVARKTDADLNALASPPPSSFTFTADVAMANDEGETATASLTFRASYNRAPAEETASEEEPATEEESAPAGPTAKEVAAKDADPGGTVEVYLKDLFDNAGTNPEVTWVDSSGYLFSSVYWPNGDRFGGRVRDAQQLRTYLRQGDSNPLTETVTVTMENDEGQTASATVTFQVTVPDDPT